MTHPFTPDSSPMDDALYRWPAPDLEVGRGPEDPGDDPLLLRPAAFTVGIRFRSSDPREEATLLRITGDEESFDLRIGLAEEDGKPFLSAELHTPFRGEPLRLRAPLDSLDPGAWRHGLIRCCGYCIELWLEGVKVDEEWPAGLENSPVEVDLSLTLDASTFGAAGESTLTIDHGALWDRPLAEAEIVGLAGGIEAVAQNERRLLGEETPLGQYWSPRGFDTGVGDCMPFYDGRRYHLFYLFDRRAHRSKWGFGAHQWAHASSPDLRQWVHHPMAVPITVQEEGSICTGSVFLHDGIYRAYYTVRTVDGSPAPLGVSVSEDGIHFTKTEWRQTLPASYNGPSARDPHVFRDPRDGRFHMIVTTSLMSEGQPGEGCLAHLTSDDLNDWDVQSPFLVLDRRDEPECPEWFEWNGWYYLVFSIGGIAHYRRSREPLGPWIVPEEATFGGPVLGVMKTASFAGNRRIGAGFLRRPEGYAGSVVFREILQGSDGTLTTGWPPEIVLKEN